MMMKTWVFFAALWSGGLCITCLDSNGNGVDWYFVYKTPIEEKLKDWRFRKGLAMFYLDVHSPRWSLSRMAINESQQAVYNTVQQIYESKNDSILHLMYNDEEPTGEVENRGGHTKGVVAFDRTSGFWLIHSTPEFPPKKSEGYAWPHVNNSVYGQTFLCITFPTNQLQNIGTQLLYNEPHFYDTSIPASFLSDYPVLKDLIQGKKPEGPPWYSVKIVTSLKGQSFTSFAKAGKFMADLYDALVAPQLKQNLLVETWRNGQGQKLSSNCTAQYKVMRVDNVGLPDMVNFKGTKDHAKWAVSTSKGESSLLLISELSLADIGLTGSWTCVGDINRMVSQFHRGGGTVCLQNQDVWKTFRNSITSYTKCP